MDLASLVGFVLVLIGVFFGMIMKGADPVAMFTNVAALLIVILSSLGATILSNPMPVTTAALKAILKIFMPGPPPDMQGTIEKITSLADQARREGLLSLEEEAKRIEDPFLQKGLRMAVDGMESTQVKTTMLSDVKAMKARHKVVQGWHSSVGIFAPSFGIIGAVVGLIAVMGKLDNPAAMGHGIGAAFVATFWGVFMANGMFLPWAAKLKALSEAEVAHKLLIVEGVIAVQQGSSPRAVLEQLNTHVPPSQRQEAA
jgi:chemotaxis protein MotA